MNDRPWLAHYDKGVPHAVEIPEAPLFYFLEEAARKYPDRACTFFKGAVISYKEMNALTDRMAAALVEMGVRKGDRVGIFMPNTPQFVIAYSGASNDIERVTQVARMMVTRMGMSNEMGLMTYGQKEELIFLGREISEQRDYSEAVAEKIDSEVRRLVDDSYKLTKKLLTKYRDRLDAVAQKLLEVETLTREEFEAIFPPPVAKKSGTPQVIGMGA